MENDAILAAVDKLNTPPDPKTPLWMINMMHVLNLLVTLAVFGLVLLNAYKKGVCP